MHADGPRAERGPIRLLGLQLRRRPALLDEDDRDARPARSAALRPGASTGGDSPAPSTVMTMSSPETRTESSVHPVPSTHGRRPSWSRSPSLRGARAHRGGAEGHEDRDDEDDDERSARAGHLGSRSAASRAYPAAPKMSVPATRIAATLVRKSTRAPQARSKRPAPGVMPTTASTGTSEMAMATPARMFDTSRRVRANEPAMPVATATVRSRIVGAVRPRIWGLASIGMRLALRSRRARRRRC